MYDVHPMENAAVDQSLSCCFQKDDEAVGAQKASGTK